MHSYIARHVYTCDATTDVSSCLTLPPFTGRAAMGLAGKIVEGAQALKSDFDEA
jgi:hypothetical protein